MLSSMRTTHIGILSLGFVQTVYAYACQSIYNNPRGLCTIDYDTPSGYFTYNGISDFRGGDTSLGNCADTIQFTVACEFTFVGQAAIVRQTETYTNTATQPTVIVPFPNAPVKSIVPGSAVRCFPMAGPFQLEDSFTIQPNTPIPPVETSEVVVVGTSALTTTTSVTTLTQSVEVTLTPNTVTSTVATGTKTVIAKPTLTTKTISITPFARTIKDIAVTYTTTTLSCIPTKKKLRRERNHRVLAVDHEIFARQDNINAETATCFGEQVTPTITSTILTTGTTTTVTIVEQSPFTITATSTVTEPAPTLVQNVLATVTKTPIFTRYRWTVLPRATTTQKVTITNTVTRLPKTRLTPCERPTVVPRPGNSQCNNPTTSISGSCKLVKCN